MGPNSQHSRPSVICYVGCLSSLWDARRSTLVDKIMSEGLQIR